MKVLYVEDQQINVLVMQALLAQRPDVELRVAMTGEDGYRAALEQPPDLLLLDLRLPDCHGADLLQRLRNLPALRDVPAAAVTADRVDGLPEGAFDEVWTKPLDVEQTLDGLDRLLALRALDRQPAGQR